MLARPVSSGEAANWAKQLKTSRLSLRSAAALHVQLGEYELAGRQQPHEAAWHFREVQHLLPATDPLHGLAAYDSAICAFYEGAYQEAADDFQGILSSRAPLQGFDGRRCALWLRHAGACAGYHDDRAKLGIPEPPRLDPLCAAAALAASLKSLGQPSDRKTVLAACRVTEEGSSLQDVLNAGPKLGVSIQAVTADDQGLRALPKPLVAYVEHDHFVSVVRADDKGVSYLCSDCGPWPGGQVSLTWTQWHKLEATIYAAVTVKGSVWDQSLAALAPSSPAPSGASPSAAAEPFRVFGTRVASTGTLAGLGLSRSVNLNVGLMQALRRHVLRYIQPGGTNMCGSKPTSQQCPPFIICCWPCYEHFLGGASEGDPVNLATGEEEYTPPADLTVYNPHGPSVSWSRIYNSLRGVVSSYEADDFGTGWSQPYNVGVLDPTNGATTGGRYILFPNGGRVSFQPSQATLPAAGAPVPCSVQQGAAMLVEWDYDSADPAGHYTITFPDRTRWITTTRSTSTNCLALSQIVDRNGNAITMHYQAPAYSGGWPELSSITNIDGTALLTISRTADGTGNITSVSDCYGRSVYYHTGTYPTVNVPKGYPQSYQQLDWVSQLVPSCTANPPARYTYGYQQITNGEGSETVPFLHTITVPSPTGTGTSTATISYSGFFVSQLTDANGNRRVYSQVDASHTEEDIYNGATGHEDYSSITGFNQDMSQVSQTDGTASTLIFQASYASANDRYRTSSTTDGNGRTTTSTWDIYGNLLVLTPPSNSTRTPAITTNTYIYSPFALGELTQSQEGSKTPTTFTYFEPSGLPKTVVSPAPGNVGGSSTVTTSFTYDSLGNNLTMTTPGNNATSAITTTFSYTTDSGYSQVAAIGQALTATDNLGNITHMRYNAQGDCTSTTDALGNETDSTYNIANQPLQNTFPATGQQGSGRSATLNVYLYASGPMISALTYDESNTGTPIRQVSYAYGPEGETQKVSGSTEPVSYTYDGLYRLRTLKDAALNTTSYFYNTAGYLAQVVCPGAGAPSAPLTAGTADTISLTSYDADGNLLTRLDGRNQTTNYSYSDPESLLTGITYPTGTIGGVSLGYDSYGRRNAMSDGTGSQTYAYDDDDDLTTKTVTWQGLPTKTVSYTFYPDGSRAGMTADSQVFSYGYDKAGRMTGLTNPFGEQAAWTYRANGWLQARVLGNASSATVATSSYTQNALGQVTDLLNQNGSGSTLSEFGSMAFDGAGNRTALTASGASSYNGTTRYTYDYGQTANPALNRSQVTGESSTRVSYTNTFSYDGGTSTGPGNPTGFKGSVNTFNVDNQQTGTGYGYDGAGNPTTYKGAALTFDSENRMTSDGTGGQASGYQGDGLRVWKQSAGTRTYFLYDDVDHPICEYTSSTSTPTSTTLAAINTYGTDGLVSRRSLSTGSTTFYTFDERGNVAQRLGSADQVLSSDLYDGYGSRTSTTPGAQPDPFGYEAQDGYYTDAETGLLLLIHRYYDPAQGRFLTRDPTGYKGGINLYSYTQNNPINNSDSDGYKPSAEAGCKEAAAVNAAITLACSIINAAQTTTTPNGAGITISEKKCLQKICRSNRKIRCGNKNCKDDDTLLGNYAPGGWAVDGTITLCTSRVGDPADFVPGVNSATANMAHTLIHEMLHDCGRRDNGGPPLPGTYGQPSNPADDGSRACQGLGAPYLQGYGD